jgi:antitoxin StbD
MDRLLTRRTASMVEMREPGKVLAAAGGEPVAILKNNRCVAYLVPVEAVAADEPRHASMDEIMAAFDAERERMRPALDFLRDK